VSGIHADSARSSRAATGQASALSRASSTDLGGSRLTAGASGSLLRNRKARLRAGRSPPPGGAAGRRIALEALRFRAVNASPRRAKVRRGGSRRRRAQSEKPSPHSILSPRHTGGSEGEKLQSCQKAHDALQRRTNREQVSKPSIVFAEDYCGTGVA
jgi:hypothetical protein